MRRNPSDKAGEKKKSKVVKESADAAKEQRLAGAGPSKKPFEVAEKKKKMRGTLVRAEALRQPSARGGKGQNKEFGGSVDERGDVPATMAVAASSIGEHQRSVE